MTPEVFESEISLSFLIFYFFSPTLFHYADPAADPGEAWCSLVQTIILFILFRPLLFSAIGWSSRVAKLDYISWENLDFSHVNTMHVRKERDTNYPPGLAGGPEQNYFWEPMFTKALLDTISVLLHVMCYTMKQACFC